MDTLEYEPIEHRSKLHFCLQSVSAILNFVVCFLKVNLNVTQTSVVNNHSALAACEYLARLSRYFINRFINSSTEIPSASALKFRTMR